MPDRRALRCGTLGLALWAAIAAPVFAQPSLSRARDLYQTADYEQSLALLEELSAATQSDRTEIGTYEVFCLLALGRTDDANRAIAAVVATDPFYQPAESVASPRVRAVFKEARRDALPSVVQREYAAAKAAFDRKDPGSTALFERLLRLLDDPDLKGPSTADLRVLGEGFRDLSLAFSRQPQLATVAPRTESEGASARAAAPEPRPKAPVTTAGQPASQVAPAVVNASSLASRDVPEITPPVTIAQPLPRWAPPSAAADRNQQFEGVLQVFINERGEVTDVQLQSSIQPEYDAALLKAARSWKFKPATHNGVPVPFVKVVHIRLAPAR